MRYLTEFSSSLVKYSLGAHFPDGKGETLSWNSGSHSQIRGRAEAQSPVFDFQVLCSVGH